MKPPVEVRVLHETQRSGPPPADLITVAVSLFEYAAHIGDCLDSVVLQTHPAIELVVVDDASRDASVAKALRWLRANEARFTRAVLIEHSENQGLAAARNTAFAQSSAAHVMVLDADNALFPRALARLLECKLDAAASLAYSQTAMFGDHVGPGYADVWTPARFLKANYVDAMALVSKSAWLEVGGYHHLQHGWEDFDLWCRFIEAGLTGVFVPEMLCRYRVHHTSMLRTRTDPGRDAVIAQLTFRYPWLDLQP